MIKVRLRLNKLTHTFLQTLYWDFYKVELRKLWQIIDAENFRCYRQQSIMLEAYIWPIAHGLLNVELG